LSAPLLTFDLGTAFSRTTSRWKTTKSTTEWAWNCTISETLQVCISALLLLKFPCCTASSPTFLATEFDGQFALMQRQISRTHRIRLLSNDCDAASHNLHSACLAF
jgi:hypothetical protein